LRAFPRLHLLDLVQRHLGEELEETDDVRVRRVTPKLPVVKLRQEVP